MFLFPAPLVKCIKKWLAKLKAIYSDYLFLNQYSFASSFLKDNPQPDLDDVQKRRIDEYWKQFGIKYPDYTWFQMYYGVTGREDPRFIPNPILGYLLYPLYNNRKQVPGWDDKNMYEKLLPENYFPYAVLHCINGHLYTHDWSQVTDQDLELVSKRIFTELDNGEAVVKITRGSSAGKGVKVYRFSSFEELMLFIKKMDSENYIIQKKIVQNAFMKQFNQSSVNIIRIVSWRNGDGIEILSTSIRFGMKGSPTDVTYKNGQEIINAVGINKDGTVNERFVSLPETGAPTPVLSQTQIPNWDELISTVKKLHMLLYPFDIVGWDFTIGENGNLICIEYNIDWPGTIVYQFANGPFAGDFSDSFLSVLKNKKKRIPRSFRC